MQPIKELEDFSQRITESDQTEAECNWTEEEIEAGREILI